jgi:hypothetical protein
VLFTGRLLRGLSASAALAALPLTAGLLMGAIALSPTPATVAAAEVLRKVADLPFCCSCPPAAATGAKLCCWLTCASRPC